MKKIIVTVTDVVSGQAVDVEIPTEQHMETLKYDIAEAVNKCNSSFGIDVNKMDLYVERLNRMFFPSDTCENTGVWNGDIFSFRPRKQ